MISAHSFLLLTLSSALLERDVYSLLLPTDMEKLALKPGSSRQGKAFRVVVDSNWVYLQ